MVTVALIPEEIGKKSEWISEIQSFKGKYNCEGINYPSEKNDWKIFEKNNLMIAPNVLFDKTGNMYPTYVFNHTS